jgi:hypothetical protein
VTGPVFTPNWGQNDGRTDPEIVRSRPVRVLNCATAAPAIFSLGIENTAPAAKTTNTTNAKTERTSQRMQPPKKTTAPRHKTCQHRNSKTKKPDRQTSSPRITVAP